MEKQQAQSLPSVDLHPPTALGINLYSGCHVLFCIFNYHRLGALRYQMHRVLFGTKANKPFMVVYSLVAIVGATMNLGLMWSIAETFNGLMVIPNLIAVFLLSGVVVKLVKEYFAGEGAASTLKNSREEGKI